MPSPFSLKKKPFLLTEKCFVGSPSQKKAPTTNIMQIDLIGSTKPRVIYLNMFTSSCQGRPLSNVDHMLLLLLSSVVFVASQVSSKSSSSSSNSSSSSRVSSSSIGCCYGHCLGGRCCCRFLLLCSCCGWIVFAVVVMVIVVVVVVEVLAYWLTLFVICWNIC